MRYILIIFLLLLSLSGCYPHWQIHCTDVAVTCARIAEAQGKKVYLAITKDKQHVQAYYLEDEKRVWMEIYGSTVQAGVAQHSDTGEIITWQEAVERWYK